VKVPDVNVLLYASNSHGKEYEAARDWLGNTLAGSEPVGFAWLAVVGFVRLSTGSVFEQPLSLSESLQVVEGWFAAPAAQVISPTARHLTLVRALLEPLGQAGNLTNDAHLAALSIEHRGVVCTADRDFGRFPGVQWENPLAA
jgi:toxin-antitoxin system PIN domain toxin